MLINYEDVEKKLTNKILLFYLPTIIKVDQLSYLLKDIIN